MKFFYLLVCLLTFFSAVSALISSDLSSSQVYVDDVGRYQNLVISINLKISQTKEKAYLDGVKTHIRWLSRAVYDGAGIQFGNVTILVPSHWKDTSYSRAFNQAPEVADVLIQPLEDREMYTQHIQGCGKQALFMAIDAVYISMYNSNEAKAKKQWYHEWMHSRYGVFDEHPVRKRTDSSSDPTIIDQQKFYHSSDSTLEPVRCSLDLATTTECKMTESSGYADIDINKFLPKSHCDFDILPPDSPSPSLMTSYELENIDLLCTKETHNDEAPNRQNRLCNGKSITEVLKTHADFKKLDEVRFKSSLATYSEPNFFVERLLKSRTIVFVLDISKSMTKEDSPRLFLATQAIGSMVEHIIEDYASIAIFTFYERAAKLYPGNSNHTVELDSAERRQEVVNSLTNVQTGGYTCISCGLELAYNFIKDSQGSASGTSFVLLTDGAENKGEDNLGDIFEKSAKEAFFIDTILLAEETDDRLADLVKGTGSRVFAATVDPSALVDGFTEIVTNRQNLSSQVIQIYSETKRVKSKEKLSDSFIVEKHLVDLAEIVFYWNVTAQPHLSFSLVRENDGKELVAKTNASTSKLGFLKFQLSDGEDNLVDNTFYFRYYIENAHSSISLISTITVNSRTAADDSENNRKRRDTNEEFEQPFGMRSFINGERNFTFRADEPPPLVSIHAYLPAGATPGPASMVVAKVTVNGIDSTNTDEFELVLRDRGTGADIIGTDNIFSAYFTNFVPYNATYYVRIRAKGEGFMRYSSTGFFAVYMDSDVYVAASLPPAPIMDLQVVQTEVNQVTVTFTAPGADLDSGIASHYRVWFSTSARELRQKDNHSELQNYTLSSIITKTSNDREELTIVIPNELSAMNETVWISFTATDDHGLESNMSNLVSSRYIADVATAAEKGADTVTEIAKCPPDTIIKCLPNMYFYIIIGGGAALLLLLLFLCLCLCLCRKRKSEDDENELHNADSPAISSISLGNDEFIGDMDVHSSDMYQQDEIQMDTEQYQTCRRQPLPSTKKRVQSMKWTQSLKRLSRKTHKPPAPLPPSKEDEPKVHSVIAGDMKHKRNKQTSQLNPVWVSSKTNKSVAEKSSKPSASIAIENLHSNRLAVQPHRFDESNMDDDIQTAEDICAKYMEEEAERDESIVAGENP